MLVKKKSLLLTYYIPKLREETIKCFLSLDQQSSTEWQAVRQGVSKHFSAEGQTVNV